MCVHQLRVCHLFPGYLRLAMNRRWTSETWRFYHFKERKNLKNGGWTNEHEGLTSKHGGLIASTRARLVKTAVLSSKGGFQYRNYGPRGLVKIGVQAVTMQLDLQILLVIVGIWRPQKTGKLWLNLFLDQIMCWWKPNLYRLGMQPGDALQRDRYAFFAGQKRCLVRDASFLFQTPIYGGYCHLVDPTCWQVKTSFLQLQSLQSGAPKRSLSWWTSNSDKYVVIFCLW
jgi:hypothetical protein